MSTCAFLSANEAVCTYIEGGQGKLALLDLASGKLTPVNTPFTEFSSLRAQGGKVAFKAGAPNLPASVVVLDPRSGETITVRKSSIVADDPATSRHFSSPLPVDQRMNCGRRLVFTPTNADHVAPDGGLLVGARRTHLSAAPPPGRSSGTGASRSMSTAGGSSGYGRVP
jgi:hypothetical protein